MNNGSLLLCDFDKAAELTIEPTKRAERFGKLGNLFWKEGNALSSLVAYWKGWQLASTSIKAEFEKTWRGQVMAFAPRTTEEQAAVSWYGRLQVPSTNSNAQLPVPRSKTASS